MQGKGISDSDNSRTIPDRVNKGIDKAAPNQIRAHRHHREAPSDPHQISGLRINRVIPVVRKPGSQQKSSSTGKTTTYASIVVIQAIHKGIALTHLTRIVLPSERTKAKGLQVERGPMPKSKKCMPLTTMRLAQAPIRPTSQIAMPTSRTSVEKTERAPSQMRRSGAGA
jgi:hypothetical protein